MRKILAAVLVGLMLVGCGNAVAGARECSEAIADIGNIPNVEAKCDHLPQEKQREAAAMASKKDGLMVFLPPYEAKKARQKDETVMQPHTFAAIHDLAMKGNYQAQRNLAFGYATGDQGIKKNHSLACAWYLLILRSDSPKLGSGDVGNVSVYCDPFKPGFGSDERLVSERKANDLYRKIYLKQ